LFLDTTLSEDWLSLGARYLSVRIALAVVSAKNSKKKRMRRIYEEKVWKMP
jgi:hypothetical protein